MIRLNENFYYDNVLCYKYNIIKILFPYKHRDEERFTLLIRDLMCLYMIDYENAGSEIYPEEEYKEILDLYDQYKKDHNSFVTRTCGELREIIKKAQSNRIDVQLNKEIATIFLEMFLESHNNPYFIITKEQFDHICDNILKEV